MAGRTPSEAVKAFSAPIQRALTCFAAGRVSADTYEEGVEGVLNFNRADDVPLNGPGRVTISMLQRYQVVKLDDPPEPRKPWKVHTTGWIYTLKAANGKAIVDFHWHPQATPDIEFPHLHPSAPLAGKHYPTGRVLVEDVLRFATECGAEPLDPPKWTRVHHKNVEDFRKGATWGTRHTR